MRSHQQEVLELVEVLELAQRRASLCMVRVGLGWLSKAIGCDGGMLRCCYGLAYYLACGCGADADADGDGDDFTLNGAGEFCPVQCLGFRRGSPHLTVNILAMCSLR